MAHHVALGLSVELWRELLSATLPVHVAGGEFEVLGAARRRLADGGGAVVRRLTGRTDRMRSVGQRLRRLWRSRGGDGPPVAIDVAWQVDVDHLGTELTYGLQRVSADAWLRGRVEGVLHVGTLAVPFRLERRVGASLALAAVRYDAGRDAIVGDLSDVGLHLGEGVTLELLSRIGELLLAPRIAQMEPVTLVSRGQVEGLFGGLASGTSLQLGVEDLQMTIDGSEATLRVRFGFRRAELTQATHA